MFEKFKDMGNLVKQAKEMKKKMEEVQNELKTLRFVGEVNNLVKVALTGELDCVAVKVLDEDLKTAIEKVMSVDKF
jgi:DNA-binding protein YbaB